MLNDDPCGLLFRDKIYIGHSASYSHMAQLNNKCLVMTPCGRCLVKIWEDTLFDALLCLWANFSHCCILLPVVTRKHYVDLNYSYFIISSLCSLFEMLFINNISHHYTKLLKNLALDFERRAEIKYFLRYKILSFLRVAMKQMLG